MRRDMGAVRAGLAISGCALALAVSAVGLEAMALGATVQRTAREARTINLVESARLNLTGEEGAELTEHGHATGTYDAPIAANFTIHPKSVTVIVTVYPHGGSITGTAQASYVVQKSTGYFGGTFTVTHGTGAFRHAAGKNLGFSGTINRYTFATTVKAHGEVSL
jgi:hypothetical protein